MAGDDQDVDDLIAGLGDDSDDDSDLGLPDGDQGAAEASGDPKATERYWEDWKEYFDPGSQNYYYHNGISGEVQWEPPAAAPADIFAFDQAEPDEPAVAAAAEPGVVDCAPEVQASHNPAVTDVLAEVNLGSDDEDTSDDDDCGLMGVLATSPRNAAINAVNADAKIAERRPTVTVEKRTPQPADACAKREDPSTEAAPRSGIVQDSAAAPRNATVGVSVKNSQSVAPAVAQETAPSNAAMGVALKNSQSVAPAFSQERAPRKESVAPALVQEAAPRKEAVEQPLTTDDAAAVRSLVANVRSQAAACLKQVTQEEPITPLKAPGARHAQESHTGQTPVGQTPVGQTPVGQTPVGQTLVGQTPVEGALHLQALSFKDAGLSSLAMVQLDMHPPLLSLCLAGNAFADHKELASQLSRLEALTNLDISRCRLKQLPLLVHCRSLEVFNASDNLVASSKGLLYCTSLRRVLLGRNRLRHVEQMETLKKLEELDVSHNQLGPTPGAALRALGGCASLRVLSVAGNPFAKTDHRSQVRNLIPSLVMIDGHPIQRRPPPTSAGTPVRSAPRSGAKASRPATEPRNMAPRTGARTKNQEAGAAEATKPAEQNIPVSSPQGAGGGGPGASSFSPLKPAPTELSDLALHAAAMQREFATMFSRTRPPELSASSAVDASLLSSIGAESPALLRHPPVSQLLLSSPVTERQTQPAVFEVYSPSPAGFAPAMVYSSPPPVLQVYTPAPARVAPATAEASPPALGIAPSSTVPGPRPSGSPKASSPSTLPSGPSSSPLDSGLLPLGLSSLGSPLRSSEPSGPKSPCRTGGRRIGVDRVTLTTPAHEEKSQADVSARISIPPASPLPLASPVPHASPLPLAFDRLQKAPGAVFQPDFRKPTTEEQSDQHRSLVIRSTPRSPKLAEPALSASPCPSPGGETDLMSLRESLRDFIGHKRALVEQLQSSPTLSAAN